FACCGEQTAKLPLPAVEGFRRVRRLSGEDCLSRQSECFVVAVFGLIEMAEVTLGVGERPCVADLLRYSGWFQEGTGCAQEQGSLHGFHRRQELLVTQSGLYQADGLVM